MIRRQEFSEKELNAVLDRLIQGKAPEEILGESGLVKDLTRRLLERVLNRVRFRGDRVVIGSGQGRGETEGEIPPKP